MGDGQPKKCTDAQNAEHFASNENVSTAKSKLSVASGDILYLFDERVAIMEDSGVDRCKAIRTAYAQVRQAYGQVNLPEEILNKVSECL